MNHYLTRQDISELQEDHRRLQIIVNKLRHFVDAPDEWVESFPLHCGVEDFGCKDRYEGANYGYAEGIKSMKEWIGNITGEDDE